MVEADSETPETTDEKKVGTVNPDGSVTVLLDWPIARSGKPAIEELTIHRPTAKQARIIFEKPFPTVADNLSLAAGCCGIDQVLVDRLDPADALMISGVIDNFFEASRGTGRKSSGS